MVLMRFGRAQGSGTPGVKEFFSLQLAARRLNILAPGTAHVHLESVRLQNLLKALDLEVAGSLKRVSSVGIEGDDVDLAADAS
jgi:hypothetical protein